MINFEYYNPVRIVFGLGEIKRIGIEAKNLGKTALLVSYHEHTFLTPLLKKVSQLLEDKGVHALSFFKITENPTNQEVEEGIELAKDKGVDLVIGIGGGSVMDAAKVIAAGVLYNFPVWNMIVTRRDRAIGLAPTDALPIILVPTLPVTSSEPNCGAIITNETTHEKCSVFAEPLYAKISILDPELTLTLPKYQTNCGGVDAISHVMEVYLSGVDDTPFQDYMMEGIIITIMECLKKLNKDPKDISARTNLMWSASVAWNGWTKAGTGTTTAMHLIAHPMTANYHIAHGVTLGIVMPAWMRHTYKTRPQRYAQLAERIFRQDTEGRTSDDIAVSVIDQFENWMRSMGLQTRLSEFGIGEEAVELLLKEIVRTAFGTDGKLASRVPATEEDVRQVLKLAL